MLTEIIMSLWMAMSPVDSTRIDSNGSNLRYNPEWNKTRLHGTSIVDVNKNGKIDVGDAYVNYYDRNEDGRIDYSTSHLINKVVPKGVYFIKKPVLGMVDVDYDGKIDYILTNYNKEGLPQQVKKYEKNKRLSLKK